MFLLGCFGDNCECCRRMRRTFCVELVEHLSPVWNQRGAVAKP